MLLHSVDWMAVASYRTLDISKVNALIPSTSCYGIEGKEGTPVSFARKWLNQPLQRYGISVAGLILAMALAVVTRYFGAPHTAPVVTVAFLIVIMASAWWG